MRILEAAAAALFTLVLLPSACSRRAKADPEQLKKADLAFAEATAKRGLAGFSSFLAEDVMNIRPDAPVVKGRQALTERWATLLNDPAMAITWQPLEAVISEAGDMGFTIGSSEITRSSGQARTVVRRGKYITIWRRQPDGAWKVVFDSGVQNTPLAKPAQ